jgi:putative inorganic carbon (HCO3(-)) transporter
LTATELDERGKVINQAIRRISAGDLAILLLASPLFLFPRPSLALTLLLLPLLWLSRRYSQGHFIPRTSADWPVLGLLIMTLVSVWVTPELLFSFRKIVGLIYHIAIFYAIVNWGQRQGGVLGVALVVIGLGSGSALLGMLGTQWMAKWSVMKRILPYLPQVIRGLPGNESGFNPNQVSGVLIIFVPLQLGLLSALASDVGLSRARRTWIVWGLCLSLILTGTVVLLAQSRTAWAALAFGLVGMGAIAMKRFRLVFVTLIIAGFATLVVLGPVGMGEFLVQQGAMDASGAVSWAGRLELWSRALCAIADFPFGGVGMNMFRRIVRPLYPLFVIPLGKDIGHAHNAFLQVALDLGLPGLVCYLALLGGTLVVGWQAFRRSRQGLTRVVALSGIVGLAVHAIWGMVDAVALGAKQGFLWWAMVGLVVTTAIHAGREDHSWCSKPRDVPEGIQHLEQRPRA